MDVNTLAMLMIEEEEAEVEMIQISQRCDANALYVNRKSEGYFATTIQNHFVNDDELFRRFFRLNRPQFNFVLSLVGDDLKRKSTNAVPEPISAEQRLAVTLRSVPVHE